MNLKAWFGSFLVLTIVHTIPLQGASQTVCMGGSRSGPTTSYVGGSCYQECRTYPRYVTAAIFAGLTLGAIFWVATTENSHVHTH